MLDELLSKILANPEDRAQARTYFLLASDVENRVEQSQLLAKLALSLMATNRVLAVEAAYCAFCIAPRSKIIGDMLEFVFGELHNAAAAEKVKTIFNPPPPMPPLLRFEKDQFLGTDKANQTQISPVTRKPILAIPGGMSVKEFCVEVKLASEIVTMASGFANNYLGLLQLLEFLKATKKIESEELARVWKKLGDHIEYMSDEELEVYKKYAGEQVNNAF